jgi:hypothetical protein
MYENAVENYLVAGVEAKGGRCPKLVDVGRKGFPDRTVLLDGEMIFVETKTKGGKLAPWQARYHKQLRALGFQVEVLWTVLQADEFLRVL